MAARVGRRHLLQALLLAAQFTVAGEPIADLKVHANGLIYDSTTMAALQAIAVDQSVSFKTCPSQKRYMSLPQARGNFIRFKKDAKGLKQKFAGNPTYAEFIRLHGALIESRKEGTPVIIGLWDYGDGRRTAYYEFIDGEEYIGKRFNESWNEAIHGNRKVAGTWKFKESAERDQPAAIWFETDFVQSLLPIEASSMISYADCMIDTSDDRQLEKSDPLQDKPTRLRDWLDNDIDFIRMDTLLALYPRIHRFKEFTALGMPPRESPEYLLGREKPKKESEFLDLWVEGERVLRTRKKDSVEKLPGFRRVVEDAVDEALEVGLSGGDLEDYCLRHVSRKNALTLMRRRRMVGGCSMDGRPRSHAQQIASLAAETASWEAFLRAHLDIMNDNFTRMSDGNYAWAGRKTYIKELESLELDVRDLLFGTAFAYQNPATNHYWGNADRLGRAMAESGDRVELFATAQDFLLDPALDDYNKVLIGYLYAGILSNLEDPALRSRETAAYRETLKGLRPSLAKSLLARLEPQ